MVKEKIDKPKVSEMERYEPGKIYKISGSDGWESICQVNAETGKLEVVKDLEEVPKNQKPSKEVQEVIENIGDKRRYVDIKGLIEHTDFKESAIRYWIGLKKIPFIKVGKLIRFDLQKIDQWIDKGAVKEKEVDK